MKTTDPRDPLDQRIDQLLASQAVKPPSNFAARTLAELEREPPVKKSGRLAPLIRFALPLAAAVVLAFVVFHQFNINHSEAPARDNALAAMDPDLNGQDLSDYEVQELLMLQDGLSGFAQIESETLDSSDELLETLETLYSI